MSTVIITHPDCKQHNPGPNHPEAPERLQAAIDQLSRLDNTRWLDAPLSTLDQITRIHPVAHWDRISRLEPAQGQIQIDPDTFLSPGSIKAALRAAGAVCLGVDQVLKGLANNAFCAVRPPGHHAEASRAMGFCLLNQVAIGAMHALTEYRLNRVAIVDFDVHHGNGTEAIFAQHPNILYLSSHQMPLYPGTGDPELTLADNIVNVALPSASDGRLMREQYRNQIFPALRRFKPELVMISAGFDAFEADPLAQLNWQAEDYYWLTGQLRKLADECCHGRIVSVLEGGYNLRGLTLCCYQHVRALSEH